MKTRTLFAATLPATMLGLMLGTHSVANAQYVGYPTVPFGYQPVNLSPTAPYLTNPYNRTTQGYNVFNGTDQTNTNNFVFPYGMVNFGYPGNYFDPSFGFSPFAYGLNTYGGNIDIVSAPYYGGFTTIGQNGVVLDAAGQGYMAANGGNVGYVPIYNPYGNLNTRAINGVPNGAYSKPTLSQMIGVERGHNFDVSIAWQGDPTLLQSMTVTLLNRFRQPITQQVVTGQQAAYFSPSVKTSAARYYKADIQFVDGARSSIVARIQ